MDDKKKRSVYIVIIILCILGTVGVLIAFNSGSAPSVSNNTTAGGLNVQDSTAAPAVAATASALGTDFPLPGVFPTEDKFSTSVLNSSKIQGMNDYSPATVDPSELYRDDPFAKY